MDRITASKVFVNIVEYGSMAAAANVLGMSRSMITRYLAEMENWAGARLLHRSTRRISLTNAGEQVLEQSLKLIEVATDLEDLSHQAEDTPQGLLRISCAQFVAQAMLIPFIHQFLKQYPRISIDLQISNHAVNLIEERIDLAIRVTNNLDPNLIARPLGQLHSMVCAAPNYIQEQGAPIQIDQLANHNCLTYSYFGKSIWTFHHKNSLTSVAVSGSLSANESTVLLDATLMGSGISLQPKYAVIDYINNGKLCQLLSEYNPQSLGIYGIYRSRKHQSHVFRIFIDEFIEYATTIKNI